MPAQGETTSLLGTNPDVRAKLPLPLSLSPASSPPSSASTSSSASSGGSSLSMGDPSPVANRRRSRGALCCAEGIKRRRALLVLAALSLLLLFLVVHHCAKWYKAKQVHENPHLSQDEIMKEQNSGPYRLVERQYGDDFFQFYDFHDGPDSEGSAGYNVYVGKERAMELGIAKVVKDDQTGEQFVHMSSTPTNDGPRESVRLEGKRRYHDGLFILDLRHMPAGCGLWPAFWLTDGENWPNNGEIDIVEGINDQTIARTAMHSSDRCDMFGHVPPTEKTGYWDTATGIPDSFTGEPNFDIKVDSDNCYAYASHQWVNQGCVQISEKDDTSGEPLNAKGGGVYALEWDPVNLRIRSWVFPFEDGHNVDYDGHAGLPSNLVEVLSTVNKSDGSSAVIPDTDTWGLPYAYFAVGPTTGCFSDHFQNMQLVFNLAFCGSVSGNKFFQDCPAQAKQFNVNSDPIQTCNAWITSDPEELKEAYWKVGGVYVYERS
uniref:GH16 domain-containing protein n=1 Tax=Craspedostauros australis TaxID=1486917 RepID=A0A7R9ZKV3_9STRA